MVKKYLLLVWSIISGGFLVLTSLYTDEIRKLISSMFGVSNETFVLYALIALALFGLASSLIILAVSILKHFGWREKHHPLRWMRSKLRRSRKPELVKFTLDAGRPIDMEHDLASFDKAFEDMKRATQPKTKARMLDYFQPELHHLCYRLPWNDEVKHRIEKVLEYIPDRLADDPHIDRHLQYLGMILGCHGSHTKEMVKTKFLKELEDLYNNPKFKNNSAILDLLQELHDSEDYIMKVIDDAGYHWDDERFNALMNNIAFYKLNQEARRRVLQYLSQKMDFAERYNDEKTRSRFQRLYDSAKR